MKLIKFETEGCTPCKFVDSFLNGKSVKPDEVYDIADSLEYAESLDVGRVPTLILFDDSGAEVSRVLGFEPAKIEELISKL